MSKAFVGAAGNQQYCIVLRSEQHGTWGQILFSTFSVENGTKIWRLIVTFYDTIPLGVIANIQKDQNIFQEVLDYFENYTARWKWVNVIT